MFFKNATRKLIFKKQIFQLSKKKSKCRATCIQPGDAEWAKLHASMNRGGESWLADKNLGKDSKNELQALQKQSGNQVHSNKELDIKIYNEKTKKKDILNDELIRKSTSKIINKLSGSSIIIVYENNLQTKASSRTSLLGMKESNSSIRILANQQKCNGDINCSQTNDPSSSSSKKLDNAEIHPECLSTCPKSRQKNIVIQCCSSKKSKKENCRGRKKQRTRMKLIPPEELSEPKCVKIVKKAVSGDADLSQDLSNMMTGGRLMKTLNSFLGADQSNYIEIVQTLNGSKKHKILLFKRQIEKCKKCQEEELTEALNVKPESKIIRLTLKKTKKKGAKMGKDFFDQPKASHSKLVEKHSEVEKFNLPKGDEIKSTPRSKNSMTADSSINVLVASTLNELTGVLHVRNNLKLPDKDRNAGDQASSHSRATDSAPDMFSKISRDESQVQVKRAALSNNSFSRLLNSREKLKNTSHEKIKKIPSREVEQEPSTCVLSHPESLTNKVHQMHSFEGTTNPQDSIHRLEEMAQSEELCRVSLDQSSLEDCTLKENLGTSSSKEITVLKRRKSKSEESKRSSFNSNENMSTISNCHIKNDSATILEPAHESSFHHSQMPTLQNDTTFLQFFDQRGLPKMGDNDFLTDPLMQSVKAGYYNLRKTYATTLTLQRLASVESVQPVASSAEHSKVQSLVSSHVDLREEVISIATSVESVVASSSQHSKKTIRPIELERHSYVDKNNDYLRLDFMNFNFNKRIDTLIAPNTERCAHGKQLKGKPAVSADDEKKKKKGTFWHRKLNACKMKKSNHRHCR